MQENIRFGIRLLQRKIKFYLCVKRVKGIMKVDEIYTLEDLAFVMKKSWDILQEQYQYRLSKTPQRSYESWILELSFNEQKQTNPLLV